MRKGKKLTIVAIIVLSTGLALFILGLIMNYLNNPAGKIIFIVASLLEVLGLIITISRFSKYGFPPVMEDEPHIEVKEVKVVNVKPVKETQEEKLYKQYENLYKEGLITKDDLDNKRKELLGK